MARRAAEDWGVLSCGELRECGLSADAISTRVRNGRLHPLHHRVYAVGHANVTLEGRSLAAVKPCGPGTVLSHYSAAALWDLVEWDGRRIEVTVSGTGGRSHRDLRVHRTTLLHRRDHVQHAGIRVTVPARTLVDLAAVVPPKQLRRAARTALSLKRLRICHLVEAIARSRGRPGVRALARIVADGHAPTRSELENVVLDLIDRGALERPDVNVPLILSGQRVIPDFRWPERRLVVEADGAKWHDNRLARQDDAERQALLEAHGERVVRVTWRQATALGAQTLTRLRAAGAPDGAGSDRSAS